ncbi:tape measure protein, partial [Morganella morganii]
MAQVGEIVYQVQMDVAQLLTSQRQLDQRLRNMEGGFNRTTTAVNGTERSMSSLSRVAASLTAYLSASAVASYAEAWTVLNNKLVNSIKAGETLAVVNQRVFDIAQNSRSSLDGIATLYSRLERAMRSAGLSGEELGQVTTTISKAMTVSGATAAESEGALVQLSQALASGVLRGQEFNSMSEQAPALMKGLADSLGVSIGELRKMAGEGKLTTDVLLKAFREMGPTIEREFANTTQTMSQSLQIASNNITKFFGENTTVKTFTRIFNDSVVTISENLDYLTNILVIAAGVIGSRYAGALALAGAAQVKKARDTMASASASRQAAVAERDAAAVLVRKTVADRDAAMSALNLARAEYQVARGSAAEATALANVTRLKTAYSNAAIIAAQANNTLSASQARVAATGLTMANALKAMNWLLAPIGGPAGAAMLAGAAVYYFFQKAEEAKRSAQEFADSLNELRASMDKMSRTELAAKIADARDELEVLTDAQRTAEQEVKNLKTAYKAYSDGVLHFGSTQENLEIISRKLAKAEANLERVQNDRSKTVNFISAAQAKLNGELLQGEELLKREASTLLPNAGAALRAYGLDLDGATKAKQKFNSASLKVEWSDAGADMKKTLEREIEMAGAKDDVVRRQLQVKYYVEDKGISEQEAEKLAELAAKAGEASEAKKTGIKISREAVSEAKKEATEAKKLKQKITDLANATKVAELETKGLSREAAILEAVQKLGSKANSAQIAEVTALAGKEYDLTQKIKDRKEAFEQNPQAKADQDMKLAGEQLERQLKGNLITEEQYQKRSIELKAEHARKTAEINAKSAVSPVQEMAAQVDPVQALANEHAQKLALIKNFENQKVITAQQSLALINAANTEYEEARLNAQWEIWRNQSQANQFLADGLDALGQRSSNVLTGLITGAQSLNDAFRNVASTIVDEAVGA